MSFDLTELNGRKLYEREAGILLPVMSLPGKYGIGDLGNEARWFIDVLQNSGQQLWAMLPNGPVGYGNSPYQSLSSCAGNHYYISPDKLMEEGLLRPQDLSGLDFGSDPVDIDYGKLFASREKMLRRAFGRWMMQGGHQSDDFLAFRFKNHGWLDDYAMFMSVKGRLENAPWYKWPDGLKFREKNTMCNLRRNLNEDITFWRFTQFQFFRQWEQLKEYAHQKGVKLIGDMPFYVNHDSADVWSRRELFDLNPDGSIKLFSGIPSGDRDIRWGNPCYDWDRMKAKNYDWLAERIRIGAGMYDIMRIDHAVAFVHYYGIKDDGARGVWYPGPDSDRASATGIIDCVARERNMDIIVENLGNNNQRTHDLYDQLNWLGMRIFQHTVGDMHYGTRNIHLPQMYPQNVAAYTGTHDNETLAGLLAHKSDGDLEYMMTYLKASKREDLVWNAIDALYNSSAAKVIIPVQDVMSLGNESRICYEHDFEKSWRWRLDKISSISKVMQNRLRGIAVLSGRGHMDDARIKSSGWKEIYRKARIDRYGR